MSSSSCGPRPARRKDVTIPACALYYVCEDVDGTCVYRRQDVTLAVQVKSKESRR